MLVQESVEEVHLEEDSAVEQIGERHDFEQRRQTSSKARWESQSPRWSAILPCSCCLEKPDSSS